MHLEALSKNGKNIFLQLKNFKGFYLAGGTALALQLGHRISIDFDLFTGKTLSKSLLTDVERVFANSVIQPSVNNPDELTIFVNGVKLTFLYYPFPVLHKFTQYNGINMLNVQELSATKAYTIGRRGSFKDYVDIFTVVAGKHVKLEHVITLAEKKYGDSFNSRLFLEQLIYLDDITDTDVLFLKKAINKEQIKRFFAKEIKRLI